ncbi:MAG: alpha/beta fold hydrolase [Actinomycetota bacterium]
MKTETVKGVELAYELTGSGDVPLVAIHGSWSSHETWSQVAPELSERLRVLTFDRRGHSASERPAGQGTQHEDVDDAAALIERLGLAPAYVVGNSFGAEVAVLLATERPELVRGLIAHEPAFVWLLQDRPEFTSMAAEAEHAIAPVLARIRAGDHAGAAELFVETVALGPGTWAHLPDGMRNRMIENAPTFLDEENAPDNGRIDLRRLKDFGGPALLTLGDQSPPMFAPIVRIVAAALPQAEVLAFAGAGHIPHATHPREYAGAVTTFIDKHEG